VNLTKESSGINVLINVQINCTDPSHKKGYHSSLRRNRLACLGDDIKLEKVKISTMPEICTPQQCITRKHAEAHKYTSI
jgi:hypothetical protein